MERLGYTVFEYAVSELETTGIPFAVLVRGNVESAIDFGMYVLEGWKDLIVPKNVWDRETIEDIIYEYHQLRFRNAAAIEDFFGSIQGLSVGPVRTNRSGVLDAAQAAREGLDLGGRCGNVSYWGKKKFEELTTFLLRDNFAS